MLQKAEVLFLILPACLSVGKHNYNYIIIPMVVAIGTAAIFGVLCFFMVKKYR